MLALFHSFFTPPKKRTVHFLHIGKTGGTAIKHALIGASPGRRYCLQLHKHRVRLRNVPEGEKVIFFVRDPIGKFVSGFYSRMRQGRPRYSNPWSLQEEIAFARFQTPNELATSLSADGEERRLAAREAMKGIGHVRASYWDWFENEDYFLSRRPDFFFIGFQESATRDFEELKRKLNLPAPLQLPTDEVSAHRTPSALDKRLDATAIENLRSWYKRDYAFLDLCRWMAKEINER